jgi:hypothetical protein
MKAKGNDEILRELNLLYDFTDEIDSECDDYIEELPKTLEYREELIESLRALQWAANDVGAIIELIWQKIENKDNEGEKE